MRTSSFYCFYAVHRVKYVLDNISPLVRGMDEKKRLHTTLLTFKWDTPRKLWHTYFLLKWNIEKKRVFFPSCSTSTKQTKNQFPALLFQTWAKNRTFQPIRATFLSVSCGVPVQKPLPPFQAHLWRKTIFTITVLKGPEWQHLWKLKKDVAKHLCVLVCGHIWIRLCTSTCTWTFKPAILLTNEFLTKNNTCSRVPSSAHKPWHPAVSHLFPGSAQCCWLNPTQFRPAIVGQSTRCSTAQRPRTMGWISDTITRPCEEQIQHEVLCGGRLLAMVCAFPLDSNYLLAMSIFEFSWLEHLHDYNPWPPSLSGRVVHFGTFAWAMPSAGRKLP